MAKIGDLLNRNNPTRIADNKHILREGDLLALLIADLTPTETGVVPAANVATLAATPAMIYQVNVTAGTTTGIKKLVISNTATPAAGEAVWDGSSDTVALAAADAATAVSFTYSVAATVDAASATGLDVD